MSPVPKNPFVKYQPLQYEIHMGTEKHLGIIVSSDWKHRFMIIKGVVPNSVAHKIGIKRNDRIFMVNAVFGDGLTLKKLASILKTEEKYVLTTLRKCTNSSDSAPMQRDVFVTPSQSVISEQLPVNGTYCINKRHETFQIHSDSSEDMIMDVDDEHEDQENDSIWNMTPTCTSVRDHFDRQLVQNARKMLIFDSLSADVHRNPEEMGMMKDFDGELHERVSKGQQLKGNQSNVAPNLDRVASWLAQQPTPQYGKQVDYKHTCADQLQEQSIDESFQANKENFMPLRASTWSLNLNDIKHCSGDKLAYTKQPDNIPQPRGQQQLQQLSHEEKKSRVFVNLNNLPRFHKFQ